MTKIYTILILLFITSACSENPFQDKEQVEEPKEEILEEVVEATPEVIPEVVEKSTAENIKEKLKAGYDITTDWIEYSSEEVSKKFLDGAEIINNLNKTSKDKVIELTNSVLNVLPLLEEVGYRTNEFKVEVSLPPVIEVRFSKIREVSEEEIKALEEKHKDERMFNMIWSILETSNSFSSKLNTDNFSFDEVIVSISIPPRVRLRYVNKK